MRFLRPLYRIPLLLLALLVLYPLYYIGGFLLGWRTPCAHRFRCGMIHTWARWWCAIVGMQITQVGAPPASPFIMVANHLSYLDIILLLRTVPAWFVSRADVANWPVFGPMSRSAHVLFIDRARMRDVRRINESISEILDRGESVLFFPEGTTTAGDRVGPFKTSLLALPAASELPVHAAAISYRSEDGDPPPSELLCWWGDMEFAPHFLEVLRRKQFHATLTFLPVPQVHGDRKELARRLHTAVSEVFTPNP